MWGQERGHKYLKLDSLDNRTFLGGEGGWKVGCLTSCVIKGYLRHSLNTQISDGSFRECVNPYWTHLDSTEFSKAFVGGLVVIQGLECAELVLRSCQSWGCANAWLSLPEGEPWPPDCFGMGGGACWVQLFYSKECQPRGRKKKSKHSLTL